MTAWLRRLATALALSALLAAAALALLQSPPAQAGSLHGCRPVGAWWNIKTTARCSSAQSILRRYGRRIADGSLDPAALYPYRSGNWSCRLGRNVPGWRCVHSGTGRHVVAQYAFD